MENLKEENQEVWKNLYDYEGYQVSDKGRIRSIDRIIMVYRNGGIYPAAYKGKVKASRRTKKFGYLFVDVNLGTDKDMNKIQKTVYLHRAVADHFVDKSEEQLLHEVHGGKLFASFKERDYSNCTSENIKWVTKEEMTIMEQTTKKLKGLIKFSKVLNWNV